VASADANFAQKLRVLFVIKAFLLKLGYSNVDVTIYKQMNQVHKKTHTNLWL